MRDRFDVVGFDPSIAATINGQVCPQEFDPFEIVTESAEATALQRDLRH